MGARAEARGALVDQALRDAYPGAWGSAALLDALVRVHGTPPADTPEQADGTAAVASGADNDDPAPLCPWCGAASPRTCELIDDAGFCAWDESGVAPGRRRAA